MLRPDWSFFQIPASLALPSLKLQRRAATSSLIGAARFMLAAIPIVILGLLAKCGAPLHPIVSNSAKRHVGMIVDSKVRDPKRILGGV